MHGEEASKLHEF